MPEPYANPMISTVRAFGRFVRNTLTGLISRSAGKTSRLGLTLQLLGLAFCLYGLFLWSPALAFVIGGVLAILIGERL